MIAVERVDVRNGEEVAEKIRGRKWRR